MTHAGAHTYPLEASAPVGRPRRRARQLDTLTGETVIDSVFRVVLSAKRQSTFAGLPAPALRASALLALTLCAPIGHGADRLFG